MGEVNPLNPSHCVAPYPIDNVPFLPYNNIVMEGCPSG